MKYFQVKVTHNIRGIISFCYVSVFSVPSLIFKGFIVSSKASFKFIWRR
jgi:hypothetical protein